MVTQAAKAGHKQAAGSTASGRPLLLTGESPSVSGGPTERGEFKIISAKSKKEKLQTEEPGTLFPFLP